MLPTSPSRISSKRRSRPSAAAAAPRAAIISCPKCWRRRWERSSTRYWATPAAPRSIWRWKKTRWFAALIACPPTSAGNPSIPGIRGCSTGIWFSPRAKKDPRAADAPTLDELFEQYKVPANSRRLAQVLLAAGDFGRPMMVTPGTPPDRVKILRDAYVKTLSDPDVLEEAKKGRMDVDPATGEELEALVKEIFDSL